MGKSVILLPRSNREARESQLLMLRERLGPGSLKLEGPFSDKGDAVAEIADQVRQRMRQYGEHDVMETVMVSLTPQNLLQKNAPPSRRSTLKFPFILVDESMGSEHAESAGAAASGATVEFKGRMARPVDATALTMVAVAVLRRLDVESHFSVYNFWSDPVDEKLSKLGMKFIWQTVPVVVSPEGQGVRVAAVVPEPYNMFLNFPAHPVEALDGDAVLSLIKIQNAYNHARKLMADIAKRIPVSDMERALNSMHRAIEIGHLLHEGTSLWTMEQVMESGENAISRSNEFRSVRLDADAFIVGMMTNPSFHAMQAASVILAPEFRDEVDHLYQKLGDTMTFIDFLRTAPDITDMCLLREYLDSASVMRDHLHPVSECTGGKGSN